MWYYLPGVGCLLCVCYSSLLSHAGALGKVGLMFWAEYQKWFEPNAFPSPLVRKLRAIAGMKSGHSDLVMGVVNRPRVAN